MHYLSYILWHLFSKLVYIVIAALWKVKDNKGQIQLRHEQKTNNLNMAKKDVPYNEDQIFIFFCCTKYFPGGIHTVGRWPEGGGVT